MSSREKPPRYHSTRPRIADVARLAKTSPAAVSVVLNGKVGESARVGAETQERIWEAVRELGYSANPAARSLAGGRNHIIGVFTFEPTFPIDQQNFYFPFLVGVEAEAARSGYDLLLFASASGTAAQRRSIYREGVNRLQLSDGAILLGRMPDRTELTQLAVDHFPFVYIGRRETTPAYPISYVAAAYTDATAYIVGVLHAHKHQHFIYFGLGEKTEATQDREAGYFRALPNGAIWRGTVSQLTAAVFHHALDTGATALLAEDDAIARTILTHAARAGKRCPDDFSLVVLGDPMNPAPDLPNWTRFRIPREAMGREAVRLLIARLDAASESEYAPTSVTLPCTFERGSTLGDVPHSH